MKPANRRILRHPDLAAHPAGTDHRAALLAAARAALARFRHEDAISSCETALAIPDPSIAEEVSARCLLAQALENLARFPEAIQTLSGYEPLAVRLELPLELRSQVCRQLGSAWLTTDSTRALGYAKQALKSATEYGEASATGDCHLSLGRIYRRIGETSLARDHFLRALREHRRTESQPALIRDYTGLGSICVAEGNLAGAQAAFAQARETLDQLPEADAPLWRGSLALNLGTLAGLRGRLREGVALLESAVSYFERARLPRLIALAHSNLGFTLLLLGEVGHAKGELEKALAEARACGARLIEANTLETLAELLIIQGDFAEAEALIRPSIATLQALRAGFNEAQAQLTLGRCRLLAEQSTGAGASAAEALQASLEISRRIGDRRGQTAARLWLIEAHLATNKTAEARRLMAEVRPEIESPVGHTHLPLVGHFRELAGRLALIEGDSAEAIRCLDQAVSIFELSGNRYRTGVASFHLSRAYRQAGAASRAREALRQAEIIFAEMDAQPMRARIAAGQVKERATHRPESHALPSAEALISGMTRLIEAGPSRELLLHELARILHRDFAATPVIIFEYAADGGLSPLAYQGCDERRACNLGARLGKAGESKVKGGPKAPSSHIFQRFGDENAVALYVGGNRAAVSQSFLTLFTKQVNLALELSRLRPQTKPLSLADPSVNPTDSLALPGLICQSAAMRRVVEQISQLRDSRLTVLITGESGTGKELIARAIHTLSGRAGRPFVAFNCAATPRELIEAQLFGYRKGAFTGAGRDHRGLIREAQGGTLLLDEIGDLARELQPKLLRFLQEGEIQPLGESRPARVDVRVIAATNRDLERMMAAGEFREDLYHRLNVVELRLPPLRERREEIPLLIEYFLGRYLAKENKEGLTMAPEVVDLMTEYDWPGNVRQLENEIMRLVALTPAGEEITPARLSPRISQQKETKKGRSSRRPTLAERVAELEEQLIREALERHQGNISRAAAELGLSRYGLRKMLSRHRLTPPK